MSNTTSVTGQIVGFNGKLSDKLNCKILQFDEFPQFNMDLKSPIVKLSSSNDFFIGTNTTFNRNKISPRYTETALNTLIKNNKLITMTSPFGEFRESWVVLCAHEKFISPTNNEQLILPISNDFIHKPEIEAYVAYLSRKTVTTILRDWATSLLKCAQTYYAKQISHQIYVDYSEKIFSKTIFSEAMRAHFMLSHLGEDSENNLEAFVFIYMSLLNEGINCDSFFECVKLNNFSKRKIMNRAVELRKWTTIHLNDFKI
jgi:hypothetical protein